MQETGLSPKYLNIRQFVFHFNKITYMSIIKDYSMPCSFFSCFQNVKKYSIFLKMSLETETAELIRNQNIIEQ